MVFDSTFNNGINMTNSWSKLETILDKASQREAFSKNEITFLLELSNKDQIDALFKTARSLRRDQFGDEVFLYGFLYISTYCRNDCSFCFYRRSNTECPRYRKDESEIVEAAIQMTVSGVHLIDLTMGEDPEYFIPDTGGLDRLAKLVESVNKATGLPIMVSPGVVPDSVLKKLSEAGATWYACYQETHRRELFSQLRLGQNYDARLNKKLLAHQFGLLIEEGLLCGVGESHDDVAESISVMQSIDADQVRVMKFIPQKGTPMEKWALTNSQRESLIIAVMRLVFPDRLIPVSLDVSGLAGLRQGLDAGANVVTSLVPPGQGLAGVAQSFLDIEDSRRTSSSVLKILETCSLSTGSIDNYISWIDGRQKALVRNVCKEKIVCSLP